MSALSSEEITHLNTLLMCSRHWLYSSAEPCKTCSPLELYFFFYLFVWDYRVEYCIGCFLVGCCSKVKPNIVYVSGGLPEQRTALDWQNWCPAQERPMQTLLSKTAQVFNVCSRLLQLYYHSIVCYHYSVACWGCNNTVGDTKCLRKARTITALSKLTGGSDRKRCW